MMIDPLWFIIALCVGLVAVYFTANEPMYVIKYPTPENAGKIVYKDSNDVCYTYRADEVACPADKSEIKQIPIQ